MQGCASIATATPTRDNPAGGDSRASRWRWRGGGLSRPSATAGGLAMAMPVAGCYLSLNLPFAAMLAWTPVMLGCASRALRAGPWRLRIGWLAATAVAWGQIASASMSDGLVIGTGALLVYGVVRISTDIRLRRRTIRQALGLAGLLILVLPLVNLAILIPRFAYL